MTTNRNDTESEEIMLLRLVNEAASDYLLALKNPGFAEHCGGTEALLEKLKAVQDQWEQEFNTLGS